MSIIGCKKTFFLLKKYYIALWKKNHKNWCTLQLRLCLDVGWNESLECHIVLEIWKLTSYTNGPMYSLITGTEHSTWWSIRRLWLSHKMVRWAK